MLKWVVTLTGNMAYTSFVTSLTVFSTALRTYIPIWITYLYLTHYITILHWLNLSCPKLLNTLSHDSRSNAKLSLQY